MTISFLGGVAIFINKKCIHVSFSTLIDQIMIIFKESMPIVEDTRSNEEKIQERVCSLAKLGLV